MSKVSKNNSLSSYCAVATIAAALLGVLLIPDWFSVAPASLKTLILFAAALLVFACFLLTTFRRRRLFLNLSPLTLSLGFFGLCIFVSIMTNNPLHATKSFLGLGGILIAATVMAIFASILVKINNTQIAIRTLLGVAVVVALATLLVALNTWAPFLPGNISAGLYAPGVNLSLMLIALATSGANFFKKGKFKGSQALLIPVYVVGLVLALYLDFQAQPTAASFPRSLHTLAGALTPNDHLDYKALLLGSKAQSYTDLYDHYSDDLQVNTYTQAYSTPLTIISLYGGLALTAWLILIGRTVWLCFDKNENNRDLYFVLLISFFVQFFTPISSTVLIIQAILIAFATNKNRQTLINFNLATFTSEKSDQKVENRDHSRHIILTLSSVSAVVLVIITFNLVRNYQGFYQNELALTAFRQGDRQAYLTHATAAVKAAPDIDLFNRNYAVAQTELMLANTQDLDAVRDHYNLAQQYAQKAIAIEPEHAANYYTYAQILEEIYSDLKEDERANQASKIVANYAQTALYQPTNPDALLALGGFYQSLGQYDTALIHYQQALKLNPDYAQTNYQLGTLYEQQNETELAQTTYTNTLQLLDADSDDYAYVQARLESLAGN